MVGLFQSTFADLRDVGEVSADLREKLLPNHSFSEEQSVQGVRVVCAPLRKGVETL